MKCRITLKPFWENETIDRMEVEYRFDTLAREIGEELCKTVISAYTVPGCEVENLRISS